MLELFGNKYPYTDFHELNLDWIISKLIQMNTKLDNFVSLNTIKYADPIGWDITKQYATNTVVIDESTGKAYISSQPVPAGVTLSDSNYWSVIFDLQEIIGEVTNNLTFHNNGSSPTLLGPVNEGDWVLWNNKLYVATADMIAGTALIEGSNIEQASVEALTKGYTDTACNALYIYIGALTDLNTTDKSSIVNAINEVLTDLGSLISAVGTLSDLNTSDKTSIVNAINSLLSDISTTIGALTDLNTSDKTSIVNAINSLLSDISTTIGALTDLNTTDKSSIVNAINELLTDIGDLTALNTTDKSSVVNAINEVLTTITSDIQVALDQVQKDIQVRTEDIFNIKSLDLDWTQDITADVEAVMQTHKRLYFPEGHYKFNITITDQDYEIWGDGWQRTYFHPVSQACITLDARGGVNCGDTYLHDFAIVGASRNYDGIRTIGEHDTDPINNCLFKDIFINDCYIGVHWNSRGIWCVFDHVWCYGNYKGLYVHLDDTCAFNHNSFTDCLFGYNMTHGVYILGQANYKVNTNQFNHCTFERNWLQGHTSSDFSNVFIYNNATSFLDCYIEGEDGAADFYVRNGDLTFRGGCSLVPRGTLICIADASSYVFIFGLHGYGTSSYKLTDSGTYNNHCYIIGSAISGYQMNSAYVQY